MEIEVTWLPCSKAIGTPNSEISLSGSKYAPQPATHEPIQMSNVENVGRCPTADEDGERDAGAVVSARGQSSPIFGAPGPDLDVCTTVSTDSFV
jgi:hypothetical protein